MDLHVYSFELNIKWCACLPFCSQFLASNLDARCARAIAEDGALADNGTIALANIMCGERSRMLYLQEEIVSLSLFA